MKRPRQFWFGIFLVMLAVLLFIFRGQIHFDVRGFAAEIRHVSLRHVLTGIGLIYACFWLRAMRWALFLKPQKPVSAQTVLGSQFIGFTAVGLFGRLADLTRPYLVAKRTGLSVSSQIAVYTVERMFDLGAATTIVLVSFASQSAGISLRSVYLKVGVLVIGVAIVSFAVAKAEMLGDIARVQIGRFSKELGEKIGEKVTAFSKALKVVESAQAFFFATALSLAMWGLIAMAYVECVRAFIDTPQLAQMSFMDVMVLMASGIGASVVQLPVIGWFTQISVLGGVLMKLAEVDISVALACSTVLFAVTSLSVIPVGLIYAQVERVSMKKVAEESSHSA